MRALRPHVELTARRTRLRRGGARCASASARAARARARRMFRGECACAFTGGG